MATLEIIGTIKKSPLGAWTIATAEGTVYELAQPLDPQLLKNGLRVKLVANPRPDLMSMYMVGTILEVINFEEIQ